MCRNFVFGRSFDRHYYCRSIVRTALLTQCIVRLDWTCQFWRARHAISAKYTDNTQLNALECHQISKL